MYLLIVLLPFLGFLSAGGFGRFLGSRGSALLSTTLVCFSGFLLQLVSISGQRTYIFRTCSDPWYLCTKLNTGRGHSYKKISGGLKKIATVLGT